MRGGTIRGRETVRSLSAVNDGMETLIPLSVVDINFQQLTILAEKGGNFILVAE